MLDMQAVHIGLLYSLTFLRWLLSGPWGCTINLSARPCSDNRLHVLHSVWDRAEPDQYTEKLNLVDSGLSGSGHCNAPLSTHYNWMPETRNKQRYGNAGHVLIVRLNTDCGINPTTGHPTDYPSLPWGDQSIRLPFARNTDLLFCSPNMCLFVFVVVFLL